MSPPADLHEFDDDENLVAGEQARRRNRQLSTEVRAQGAEIEELKARLKLMGDLGQIKAKPAKWLQPKAKAKARQGIANLLLSDLHLDEVVKPEQIDWINSYDRSIAEFRLRQTFERFVVVSQEYISGMNYDGACVWLGGDIFSGNIHEELKETNEVPILSSLDFWVDPMVSGLRMVADAFGKVHVPCVVGNHGRLTRKPTAKNRVPDNFDWFFYRVLNRILGTDPRFTWQIPDSPDTLVPQYGTDFLFTHGDQFRGGSGIAGMLSPIMIGDSRKRKRQLAVDKPYDIMVMGHWHSYFAGRGLLVNGSLKGLDEYAYVSNFDFEQPQQAFWVTTPEHGVTFSAPIVCQNRAKEGW